MDKALHNAPGDASPGLRIGLKSAPRSGMTPISSKYSGEQFQVTRLAFDGVFCLFAEVTLEDGMTGILVGSLAGAA
ncbi:MAG: hypothetical protein M5U34_11270 [Chloroflexi bacterium]|nr:hypothetical protein [Chloroflexota bacterium]